MYFFMPEGQNNLGLGQSSPQELEFQKLQNSRSLPAYHTFQILPNSGYVVKYSLSPCEIPCAWPLGFSSGPGYISPCIPPLVTIQVQYYKNISHLLQSLSGQPNQNNIISPSIFPGVVCCTLAESTLPSVWLVTCSRWRGHNIAMFWWM